jgi:hypothetical protein
MKSEIQRPKSERNPKFEGRMTGSGSLLARFRAPFRVSAFGLHSDFDLWISNLVRPPAYA